MMRILLKTEEVYFCRDTCINVEIANPSFKVNDMIKFKYHKSYGIVQEVVNDIQTRYKLSLLKDGMVYRSYNERKEIFTIKNFYKIHWLTIQEHTQFYVKYHYKDFIPEHEIKKLSERDINGTKTKNQPK
jgi:hypothetical protein